MAYKRLVFFGVLCAVLILGMVESQVIYRPGGLRNGYYTKYKGYENDARLIAALPYQDYKIDIENRLKELESKKDEMTTTKPKLYSLKDKPESRRRRPWG